MLTLEEASRQLTALNKDILLHNEAYFVRNSPVISDVEYDKLTRKANSITKKFPTLMPLFSASQRVGAPLPESVPATSRLVHSSPMLSLENAFDEQGINSFLKRCTKILGNESSAQEFTVEPKIDGLSLSIQYENGVLTRAATRGNGMIGENVTAAMQFVSGIPLTLSMTHPIEVRGEVYIGKKDFMELNLNGSFSTARNAASGSLRLQDLSEVQRRKLRFFAYDLKSTHADIDSGMISLYVALFH